MAKINNKTQSWTVGTWETPLLDITLRRESTNQWNTLTWEQENTDDETKAYVRVDILDSSKNVLQSNLRGTGNKNKKTINLANYANVKNVSIHILFRLYGLTKTPIVKNIEIK